MCCYRANLLGKDAVVYPSRVIAEHPNATRYVHCAVAADLTTVRVRSPKRTQARVCVGMLARQTAISLTRFVDRRVVVVVVFGANALAGDPPIKLRVRVYVHVRERAREVVTRTRRRRRFMLRA